MRAMSFIIMRALLFVVIGIVAVGSGQASPSADARFMVTVPHTREECLNALDEAKTVGSKFLGQCDWGCMAGDHTCYVIIHAKDEAAAKKMLPASWHKAKIVQLNKFTPEQIASFHKK